MCRTPADSSVVEAGAARPQQGPPCAARRYAAYGGVYIVLEVLALPAVPLTMTAGLLFGVGPGAAVVSVSSTAAATISFLIARYAGAPRASAHASCRHPPPRTPETLEP